jgi:predicted nucleic acid-binding protein
MIESFYVDTCVYLNLWKKEGDASLGTPYWILAKRFFERFENKEVIFYYSEFVLRELQSKLTAEEFYEILKMFKENKFKKIYSSEEDVARAREIESDIAYYISFYDILHILLSKRSDSVLITRDKKLIEIAGRYSVIAKRPEEHS